MNTEQLDKLIKTVGTASALETLLNDLPHNEDKALKLLYVVKDKPVPTALTDKISDYMHRGIYFIFDFEFIKGLKRYNLKEMFLYFIPYEIKKALSDIIDYNTQKVAKADESRSGYNQSNVLLHWDKSSGAIINDSKGIAQLIKDAEYMYSDKPSYKGLTKEKLEEIMDRIFTNNKVLTKTFSHNYSKAIDGYLIIRDALIIIAVGIDGEVRIGYSFHNPIEPYDKDKGLMIAEGRLAKSSIIGKLTCVYQDRLKYIAKQYAISVINKKFYDICDRIITNLKNQNNEASSSGSSGAENSQHVD